MRGHRDLNISLANLTWIVFLLSLISLRCQAYFSGVGQIYRNHQPKLDDKIWESYISSLEVRDETVDNDKPPNSDITTQQEAKDLISESSTHDTINVSRM